METERERFEAWYYSVADLNANPVGSRICHFQWAAWQAAVESRQPTPEAAEPVAMRCTNGAVDEVHLLPLKGPHATDERMRETGWTLTPLFAHPPKPEPTEAAEAVKACRWALTALNSIHGTSNAQISAIEEVKNKLRKAVADSSAHPPKPEPTEAAQQRDLVTLTGNQAEAILEAFGGEGTTVTIRHLEASKDEEDGSDMPAGLYLYYTEYPEEGVTFLGEEDQDYRPPYLSDPKPPAEWMERCAEDIGERLMDAFKGLGLKGEIPPSKITEFNSAIHSVITKHAPKVPEGGK